MTDLLVDAGGRTVPESFEAYRQRVRAYLGDRDPLDVLRSTPSELDGLLAGCEPAEATRRPSPGKWSIVEIVAHMCDAELAFGWRVRSVVAEPDAFLPWFDQDKWAADLGYVRRSLATELLQFRAFRNANLVIIEAVDRDTWSEHFGTHAVRGRQTLVDFVELEAGHDLNHLRQIMAILEDR